MKIEVGKSYKLAVVGERVVHVVDKMQDGRFLATDFNRSSCRYYKEDEFAEEYTPPVVEKLYTNVIEGVRDCAKYGFCVSDTKKQPVPYVDNDSFEQRAIVEVTVTDGKVTGAKLYESPEGDGK